MGKNDRICLLIANEKGEFEIFPGIVIASTWIK